mgnify:CR=1 FL=1
METRPSVVVDPAPRRMGESFDPSDLARLREIADLGHGNAHSSASTRTCSSRYAVS